MEGLHNDKLLWPLTGKFAVTLLNQVIDTGYHSVINGVEDANRIVSSLVDFNAEDVWDQPRFIKTHTLLHSQYLKMILCALKCSCFSSCNYYLCPQLN